MFNKQGVGLSAPMGKPFVVPCCVVGLNIVGMQAMLQALVRLCRFTNAASGLVGKQKQPLLREACDIKNHGFQYFKGDVLSGFYFPRWSMPSGFFFEAFSDSVLH